MRANGDEQGLEFGSETSQVPTCDDSPAALAALVPNPKLRLALRYLHDPKEPTCGSRKLSAAKAGVPYGSFRMWLTRVDTLGSKNRDEYVRVLLNSVGASDSRAFERLHDLIEDGDGTNVAAGLRLLMQSRRFIGNGHGNGTTINIVNLGVKDEAEGKRLIDLGRAVEELTPAETVKSAVEVLRAHLVEHPEQRAEVLNAIGEE